MIYHSSLMVFSNIKLRFMMVGAMTLLFFAHCRNETAYQKKERLELAKGVRKDSLFFGYYLGMPRKAFYDKSWANNKQGLVTNGQGAEILCKPQGFKSPVQMIFFPDFEQEKIARFRIKFTYESYSYWNKQFSADSVLTEVIPVIKQWLDVKDFMEIQAPNKPTIWANVEGNRQILIFKEDEQFAKVLVSDLTNKFKPKVESDSKEIKK
ncbi:MAG: hypothetical protein RLZZ628_4448 [Bacteroidota bacterium]|jgi:hypothetical protein